MATLTQQDIVPMPYIKIETNIKLDHSKEQELLKDLSEFLAALLNKSEEHVMLSVSHDTPILFGKSSEPAAYVELKSMAITEEICGVLSEKICGFLKGRLDIIPSRIYIEFSTINGKMFGCNSKTF